METNKTEEKKSATPNVAIPPTPAEEDPKMKKKVKYYTLNVDILPPNPDGEVIYLGSPINSIQLAQISPGLERRLVEQGGITFTHEMSYQAYLLENPPVAEGSAGDEW